MTLSGALRSCPGTTADDPGDLELAGGVDEEHIGLVGDAPLGSGRHGGPRGRVAGSGQPHRSLPGAATNRPHHVECAGRVDEEHVGLTLDAVLGAGGDYRAGDGVPQASEPYRALPGTAPDGPHHVDRASRIDEEKIGLNL